MKLGMVGLPNSGKSTLFNALTNSEAAAGNYPFSTVDKNVGIVPVGDSRLAILQEIYGAKKVTQATIEFVDIAGLVRGSSGGGGMGNKFLSHIREMDGLVQVVRCFDDENIPHVDGNVDPVRDMETIRLELIFADMETVTKRIDKVKRDNKSATARKSTDQGGIIGFREEITLLERLLVHFEEEKTAAELDAEEHEHESLAHLNLLTNKPMIYVANVDEADIGGNAYTAAMQAALSCDSIETFIVAAKVEEELVGLDDDQKKEFLTELGITSSGLDQVTEAGYRALNLMSFLTGGPNEVRAWTIPVGTKAVKAAGKIHSDIERGFIRAEIVNYDVLVEKGSYNACKDAGLTRLEGKEYVIQEGDVVLFRFNV